MKIVVDDVSYYVEICGKGTPLLLLHGFTGDSRTWHPFIPMWEKNFQLIMIDIIGHGKTDAPLEESKYDILTAAKHLHEILQVLQINNISLLGYSMGGRLALTFVLTYPNFVKKLILESASPGLKTEEQRRERRIQDNKLGKYILEAGMERFVGKWENIPLFSSQKNLNKEQHDKIRQQRLQNNALGLNLSLIGMGTGSQPSWWDHLQEIKSETLLLTGEYDKKFCLIAEEMATRNNKINWKMIKEAGHAIHVEKPKIFGTIVDGFLANQE
ncbi:2-succinyl-6-hydroxy-2,4-cyclohexadiene-1-carboxylate synthase [Niallia sp. 01092]|uniref:2-succinyl-6-hydroxy-2, 4-cyclohexadiene-1-carboxylate synthase n=1 Tax=unclassified Niallia TaxID=2837522 RepID=UPI003FD2E048